MFDLRNDCSGYPSSMESSIDTYLPNLFIAALALHRCSNPLCSPRLRRHPLPHHPWWIVAHVQRMSTLQPRRPMPFFILIKSAHRTPHPSHLIRIP
jgi:hypothetical protein